MDHQLLLISGSLRAGSNNTAALRTVQQLAPVGTRTALYRGLPQLPAFNPDDDTEPLPPEVARLRAMIRAASAITFSTPEYAGALPGSFKNLLDWTIGDGEPGSIYEKPASWINTSPRGAAGAHDELRVVLTYAHAQIVEEACVQVPITSSMIGPDGLVIDESARDGLARAVAVLVDALAGTAGSTYDEAFTESNAQ
jgi:NAD(P)H-dependent FMN reductase